METLSSRHFCECQACAILMAHKDRNKPGGRAMQQVMSMAAPAAARSRFAPLAETLEDLLRTLDTRLGPILDLIVRIWLAQTFLASGLVKTLNWDSTVELYTSEHPVPGVAPDIAAVIGTGFELVCPLLLTLGLLTPLAVLPLLLTAAFLQFTYLALATHVYWMLLLGLLFLRGPGAISIDHLIAPHLTGSALPLASLMSRLGRAFRAWGEPVLVAFIRLWLAFVLWSAVQAAGAQSPVATAFAALLALALALGLGTRPAALIGAASILVLPLAQPETDEAILLAFLFAGLVLRGGGPLSLDGLFARRLLSLFPSLAGDPAWLQGAPRVVIVGAGFGGVAAALGLRHAWARVTLIDRRNYHLFQPLLYQVATASLSPADIATPIRTLLRGQVNARTLMGRVTAIDVDRRDVLVDDRRIPYDYLVLATGAKHSYFGKDGWEAFAPGLKKIDDATATRGRILAAFERAETAESEQERRRLVTFVIVGGGPTGVELAGAIAELARHGMRDEFRAVDPSSARVILVQSAPRLLPAMAEKLSERARVSLETLGVEVRLGAKVEDIDDGGVRIGNERIEASTVLWAAGVTASAAGRWLGVKRDNAGRIVVDEDLSVPGLEGVFAIGDTAACPAPAGGILPGLAAVAKQQGQHVAKAIRARIEGRPDRGPFRYRDYGSMATIGRKAAVADLLGVKLSGAPAWWLWGVVHVAFLVDVRSRIAVLVDWFWSYLTYARGMRLITGNETAPD
jgi:NADH dehydrogenase/putative oxidoreductase